MTHIVQDPGGSLVRVHGVIQVLQTAHQRVPPPPRHQFLTAITPHYSTHTAEACHTKPRGPQEVALSGYEQPVRELMTEESRPRVYAARAS